ncbi:hypothetical protein [Gymnodinialimonas ulvae]|uniref:hypothetical protein n=1 Tax=Gymnodinialimonas ulvae TaxID=3126504 RepID=UPI0030AC7CE9
MHENKRDFDAEVSELHALKDACGAMIAVMRRLAGKEGEAAQERVHAIVEALDQEARKGSNAGPFQDPYELLRSMAARQGQSLCTVFLAFDFERAIDQRLQHLEAQRLEYWSQSHRPPNHFARIIALRFSQAIARNTGKRPTFGTARDGNHPSTDFGRALEDIFELLEIKGDVRRPAEWALSQLTDADFQEPRNALNDLVYGFGVGGPPRQMGGILGILPDEGTQSPEKDPDG